MKKKIAIIRGKFLNKYEMQFYEPLIGDYDITAFGSLYPFHDRFAFPVVKLPSPMDLPDFPYKMPLINRLFTDAHYLYGLEEKLKGFDLVHSAELYYRYTQQALNAKAKGYVPRVIATVLENIPFNNEGIPGRKAYKYRARHDLDHLIALTQKTKAAMLAEGADEGKITVISHFVDTSRFYPEKIQQSKIADSELKNLTILYAGRLEMNKGVLDILRAAEVLLVDPELRTYHLKFRFVGEGTARPAMDGLIQTSGIGERIEFATSDYDAMPSEYHKAHIFIAPSIPTPTWDEQYNTALLEAQASGMPIVTTRTGGIPENVGEAALLTEPGNVTQLVTALKQFILDAKFRHHFARKARSRAVSVHDRKIGASKISALYQKVLA
jgi:alpha-maltose-1-phosphate synthase